MDLSRGEDLPRLDTAEIHAAAAAEDPAGFSLGSI